MDAKKINLLKDYTTRTDNKKLLRDLITIQLWLDNINNIKFQISKKVKELGLNKLLKEIENGNEAMDKQSD